MNKLDFSNDVAQIISNIIAEQIKSQHTNSCEFQVLLEKRETDKIILKSIFPIYKVLDTLHNDNKIDTEDYNDRRNSLTNILRLLEDVNDISE